MRMSPYYVYKYSGSTDDYGQDTMSNKRTSVDMYIRPYSHTNTGDMRYSEAEYVGLTKEILTDKDLVEINDCKYSILYFLPTDRYNEVFMRKCNG